MLVHKMQRNRKRKEISLRPPLAIVLYHCSSAPWSNVLMFFVGEDTSPSSTKAAA